MIASPRPLSRSALVAAGRNLNTSLDRVFDDMNSLTAGERDLLAAYTGPDGATVVVHPGAAARDIEIVRTVDFVEARMADRGPAVDTVVVADVGSSALGTAALARDVANFTHRPVAGIVSGPGMADVIAQAAGGWFVFVARNTLRDALARVFDALHLRDHVRDDATHRAMQDHFTNVHQFLGSIDVLCLVNSQPLVKRERVPGAWHSTNEALRGHLSVAAALARATAA